MKTVINLKQLLLATAFIFCAGLFSSLSAQASNQRVDVLPDGIIHYLSATEMNGLHPTDYNKAVIIYYLKTQLGVAVGTEKPSKDQNSMEARIALTLVKALSDKDRSQIHDRLIFAGAAKNSTSQSLVPCSGLNYPNMWYYLDLCK